MIYSTVLTVHDLTKNTTTGTHGAGLDYWQIKVSLGGDSGCNLVRVHTMTSDHSKIQMPLQLTGDHSRQLGFFFFLLSLKTPTG